MKNLVKNLLITNDNKPALVLRLILGAVLFAHGAQSMTGWFGGSGFTSTMQYFTETIGLDYIIGFSVINLQFFGPFLF